MGGSHEEMTAAVDGGTGYLVAGLFFGGDGFTGQGGFVQISRAFGDDAVHWNGIAGLDGKDVADGDLFGRDDGFGAVVDAPRGFGSESEQPGDGFGGFAFGAGFEVASECDQGEDGRCGFEVEIPGEDGGAGCVAVSECVRHAVEAGDAGEDGCAGADGDEGIHIRRACDQGADAFGEAGAVGDEDGQCQQKLGEGENEGVFRSGEKAG